MCRLHLPTPGKQGRNDAGWGVVTEACPVSGHPHVLLQSLGARRCLQAAPWPTVPHTAVSTAPPCILSELYCKPGSCAFPPLTCCSGLHVDLNGDGVPEYVVASGVCKWLRMVQPGVSAANYCRALYAAFPTLSINDSMQ